MEQGVFRYANPDVIHWGAGCVAARLRQTVEQLGARRVFLITTRSVARNPALLGILRECLGELLVGQYDAITAHAPSRSISEAAATASAARPDALLSLGGGSPIDATKAVVFTLATGVDLAAVSELSQLQGLSLAGRPVLPHVAIPTTLSAAELASGAGFTSESSREKLGLRVPELLPSVVFYDASLTVHTPLELWLSSGIRAVDHAVEGILAPGHHPFSDTLALEGLRRLRRGLIATSDDPSGLGARTESQLGAWFSYTLPGPSAGGLSHTLGKRLGSRHDIPHGVTSCLLLPHVMRYLAPRTAHTQARIAEALGVETTGLTADEAAKRAADAVEKLVARLNLPQHLGAFGLAEADLVEAVRPVASEQYPFEDLIGILRAAW